MKTLIYSFLLLFCLAIACNSPISIDTEKTPTTTKEQNKEKELLPLIVNSSNLRIRDKAGLEGGVVAQVMLNDTLYYMGKVSSFTTSLTLGGKSFNEPWLKVKLPNGEIGWVYAGCVDFKRVDDGILLQEELLNIRLYTFFGDELGSRIRSIEKKFEEAELSTELAAIYEEAGSLRDSMSLFFDNYFEKFDNEEPMPDLYWMSKALDGFVANMVAEGTSYYLFYDYRDWYDKALRTIGDEDEAFFDLCYSVFESDSIEYFFKNWFLQTSDYEGSSLLGEGKHLAILNKMESLTESTKTIFRKPIGAFREELVNDILYGESYWRSKDDIVRELDNIINQEFEILTAEQKLALKDRRVTFTNPKENNISINMRNGDDW